MAIENENENQAVSQMPDIGGDLSLEAIFPLVQEVEGGAKVNYKTTLTQIKTTLGLPEVEGDILSALNAANSPTEENPFATIADIPSPLSADIQNALTGASSPSAENVFLTFDDVPLTKDQIDAIQAASSPSNSNPFLTIVGLIGYFVNNALVAAGVVGNGPLGSLSLQRPQAQTETNNSLNPTEHALHSIFNNQDQSDPATIQKECAVSNAAKLQDGSISQQGAFFSFWGDNDSVNFWAVAGTHAVPLTDSSSMDPGAVDDIQFYGNRGAALWWKIFDSQASPADKIPGRRVFANRGVFRAVEIPSSEVGFSDMQGKGIEVFFRDDGFAYMQAYDRTNNVFLPIRLYGSALDPNLSDYANNSAAISAGLSAGQLYHTAGTVKVVI